MIRINTNYCFKENEIKEIIRSFGKDFYIKLSKYIEKYAGKWKLDNLRLIHSYSVSCVFICHSEIFGDAVLKIGNPGKQVFSEFSALCEYDGRRFCKVYDADIENGVILEECIQPGYPLRAETSLDKRLSVFLSLYKGLHITPARAEIYSTYTDWVIRITEYMSKRQDCKELYAYMQKANDIYLTVSDLYPQKKLLHGDLHHDNILLDNSGEYKIIDPKGVVGDPVFDIPQFILNELDDEITAKSYKKINDIISAFEKNLNIPNDIIKKCFYVETAMGECWTVEDGASYEEYPDCLKRVIFAEAIMQNQLSG